ncbi:MAG: hypothetical protein KDA65_09100 [Planctomycetaceae bacterium]|nr:hypothetical protein [Planctomycetaceae bacterium]
MQPLRELPFRGERDYVHGTHLFDRLTELDPQPKNIDYQLHRQIYHQCEVSSEPDPDRKHDLVTTYKSDGLALYVYETELPVVERVPCLEKAICAEYEVQDKMIEFNTPPLPEATFIESIVAAYKMILGSLYPENSKYLFARLMLKEIPNSGMIRVRHQRQMGPNFFQGELRREDEPLGSIFFGLNQ